MVSLFAAFLQDVATSPVGGIALTDKAVADALTSFPDKLTAAWKRPMTTRTLASWAGMAADPIDLVGIEATMPTLNSFYTTTGMRPTMLRSGRINTAGWHTLHSELARAVGETKMNIDPECGLKRLLSG